MLPFLSRANDWWVNTFHHYAATPASPLVSDSGRLLAADNDEAKKWVGSVTVTRADMSMRASMSSFLGSSARTDPIGKAFIGSRSLGTLPGMPEMQRSRLQMIRCADCVRCLRRTPRAVLQHLHAWLGLIRCCIESRDIKSSVLPTAVPCRGGRLTAAWLTELPKSGQVRGCGV